MHEEENDPACPGGEQCLWSDWTRQGLLGQKGVQGQPAETEGHLPERVAAGE